MFSGVFASLGEISEEDILSPGQRATKQNEGMIGEEMSEAEAEKKNSSSV